MAADLEPPRLYVHFRDVEVDEQVVHPGGRHVVPERLQRHPPVAGREQSSGVSAAPSVSAALSVAASSVTAAWSAGASLMPALLPRTQTATTSRLLAPLIGAVTDGPPRMGCQG